MYTVKVKNFLGFPLYFGGIKPLVQVISSMVVGHDGVTTSYLSCLNPHSVAVASKDDEFRVALKKADILVPDGIGCVLGAKILGFPSFKRISGYEVFDEVSSYLNSSSKNITKIFFLGSSPETLEKIRLRYERDYPNLSIVGLCSPPFCETFTASQDAEMINAINESKADILWVGLSSPKQDLWMARNVEHLNVSFCAGIGAVFDFYAGNIKRSPKLLQALGLEWLHRLTCEPRRLWRRTFVSAPIFITILIKGVLGNSDAK